MSNLQITVYSVFGLIGLCLSLDGIKEFHFNLFILFVNSFELIKLKELCEQE